MTATIEIGYPSDILLRTCRPSDVIVVGTHGHRPVARVLLGSTSTTLATHSTCPVLVARGTRPRDRTAPVIVGVEVSPASRRAVEFAVDEAELHGTTLRAVTAVTPVVDALGVVSMPSDEQMEGARLLLSEALAGPREDHPRLAIETVTVQEHPVDALLRLSRGALLLVVGTRGRSALAAALLGSVTREALQRAQCPVLVVPVTRPA